MSNNELRGSGVDIDDVSDILTKLPYFKHVVSALQWARRKRIKTFLYGLDGAKSELSEADRARFEAFINSDAGRELLAEYADAAVRARSETAIAAFALLYSDPTDSLFDRDFKASAALALDGISERVIDAFIVLMSEREALPKTPDRGPYPVFVLRDTPGTMPDALCRWSTRGNEWLAAIHDLVAREILRPDASAGMRLGDENQTWCCYFGVDRTSEAFAALLMQARRYLRGNMNHPSAHVYE